MCKLFGLVMLSAALIWAGGLFSGASANQDDLVHRKPPKPAPTPQPVLIQPPPVAKPPAPVQPPAPNQANQNRPSDSNHSRGGERPNHDGHGFGRHGAYRNPYFHNPGYYYYSPDWTYGNSLSYYYPDPYYSPPFVPINPPPPGQQADNPPPIENEKPANDRATNRQSVLLAWKFIGYGDKQFGNRKYADALDRYRKAVEAAPQLADGYFRLGFAQTALGRYDLATKAINHGLELDPKWPQSDFKLEMIFGNNEELKRDRIEAMVKKAEKNHTSGDLAFLAGIHLYFDGQKDRAKPLFRLAAQILPDAEPVNAFLRDPAAEE